MALVSAVSHLLAVLLILGVFAAWGTRVIEWLGLEARDPLEGSLFAVGLSVACLVVVLFALVVAGWLRWETAVGLLVLMAASAGRGWMRMWRQLCDSRAGQAEESDSWVTRGAGIAITAVLALEGLLAMAPLTGSDAMHYHFTVPLLEEGHRLLPIFWLTHSFFLGDGHLLISLGLVLGSDRIALGLLWLGGALATLATLALARQLMPERWARTAALAFAASPMVFWQGSTAGSPDLWMAFFVPLTVLAVARSYDTVAARAGRWLALGGFFAGAAAGVKYTGWVFPTLLVLWVLVARRSLKAALVPAVPAVLAGIWPLARNWMWTGDPVFPFLTPLLAPKIVNPAALSAIRSMTSTEGFGRDALRLLRFPVALVLHGDAYGLGQYFGPLVLAFGPLLFWARWEKPAARLAGLFWAVAFGSILVANQMGRFLLPVFPLALAVVFSGAAAAGTRGSRVVTSGCAVTIAAFLVFAAGADAMYAKNFLPVVVGRETREAFLRRAAPDYEIDEFIESALRDEIDGAQSGRVMVFYRHLYYLRVPFVEGAPEYSWLMSPSALRDPRAMLALLERLDVKWIVKTDEYPATLDAVLSEMQRAGELMPMATADVENLTGASRIYRQTEKVHVTVFRVNDRN